MGNRMDPKALARKHLDRRLASLRSGDALTRPPRGWVRAIRDALGMTTRQLAKRMHISQSTVTGLEKGEMHDSVSLRTLRNAAEALNCTLVYALLPNVSLEETVRDRARQMAEGQLARTNHTMSLENQALTARDLATERDRLADELMRGDSTRLWDEL